MTILALDASTHRGSVALLADGEVLLDESFRAERTHSAMLFSVLERCLALGRPIDLVAVGLGPGSYAGIRIALAAALGLELGLNARVVGLPSALALETAASAYLAIGDARRDTFYFTRIEDGVCLDGPRLIELDELRRCLAAAGSLPVLVSEPLAAAPLAQVALPHAVTLARLAEAGGPSLRSGELEPIYLREPHITQPKAPFPPLR